MNKLLICCLLIFSPSAFPQEASFEQQVREELKDITQALKYPRDHLALKGGVGMLGAQVNAINNNDEWIGPGLNTHFSYVYKAWDIGLSGYIFFGKLKKLRYNISGNDVEASGSVRTVAFTPMLRYTTNWIAWDNWRWFFGAGPSWSMQTFSLSAFTDTTGKYRDNHKLTFESRGFFVGFGLQEVLPNKEMHPVFLELLYGRMQAQRTSLVDATNFAEVQTVSFDDEDSKILGHIIVLSFGLTIF